MKQIEYKYKLCFGYEELEKTLNENPALLMANVIDVSGCFIIIWEL